MAAMEPRRVVVIDDEEDFAEMLVSLLCQLNHKAVAAFDATSGIEAIRRHKADVAFIDLGMPIMDGFSVARLIQESQEFKDLQMFALTGFDNPKDVVATLNSGFAGHIAKPASTDVILEVLRRNAEGEKGPYTKAPMISL